MEASEPIHVYSDVICPWCYVGKTRLDKALAQFKAQGGTPPQVYWHPYELDPDTPAEGEDRRERLAAKYGEERLAMMDERLETIAKAEGIRLDAAERVPNTFQAHRLIAYAQERGLGDAMAGRLFKAHFSEGRDVGDKKALIEFGVELGLPEAELQEYLAGNQGADLLREEELEATRQGLRGVPYYLINRHPLMGAAEVEIFLRALSHPPHGL